MSLYAVPQSLPQSMSTQGLEQAYVPELGSSLYFDPETDFLGKGTVGEVFRARTEQVYWQPRPRNIQLVTFFSRKPSVRQKQNVMPSKGFSTVESVRISPESVKSWRPSNSFRILTSCSFYITGRQIAFNTCCFPLQLEICIRSFAKQGNLNQQHGSLVGLFVN